MLVVLPIAVLAFGFCVAVARLPMRSPHVRIALGVLLALYVGIVLVLALLGRHGGQSSAMQLELLGSHRGAPEVSEWGLGVADPTLLSEIILNILLFVPLGALLPFVWNAHRKGIGPWKEALVVAAVAFLLSLLAGLCQWRFNLGLFELDDLLGNTLGAVLGYLAYRFASRDQYANARHLRQSRRQWLGLLALLAIVGVFYLTFQTPGQTKALSTAAVRALAKLGIVVTSKMARHYVHYVMYFGLGIALFAWERSPRTLLLGCLVGLADEGLKIWLPTREFDGTDLVRDVVGLLLAYLVVTCVRSIARRAT